MLICASSAPLASEGKYNVTKIRGELGHSASSPAVNAISGPLDSYVEDQTQRSLAMDIKSSSAAAMPVDEFGFPSPYSGGNGGHWAKAVANSRKGRAKMRAPPNSVEDNVPMVCRGQKVIDLEDILSFSSLEVCCANNDLKTADDNIEKLNKEIAEISAELDRANDAIRRLLDGQQKLLAILREKLIKARLA